MAQLFAGTELINSSGEKISPEVLLKFEKIGLYFSSNWCPDCKPFTPMLAQFYDEVNEDVERFEVIYISSDEDETAQLKYMKEKHGEWFALPVGDAMTKDFKKKFQTFAGKEQAEMGDTPRKNGIPTLIVLNSDGSMVCDGDVAGNAIKKMGPKAFDSW
ncbi:hypothetical protein CYMTET_14720 [Cymbomonas tetramitiformis]|uniref:Thioredoxin domain-containing protein n=1 Tax=Cymbomonas tetramitiformis TaxID=36881 RepID=A0AAE0L9R2_9CHLO|nr:hypothetical protein CYMTET_14720 [Cymbomonas tetramitiformis]